MNRVALIIGQADSLCEAICTRLTTLNYRVVVMLEESGQRQNEWLAALKTIDCNVHACLYNDESSKAAIRDMALTEQQAGSIDVLVLARPENRYPKIIAAGLKEIGEILLSRQGRIVVVDSVESLETQEEKLEHRLQNRMISVADMITMLTSKDADKPIAVNTVTAGRFGKISDPAISENAASAPSASSEYLDQHQEIAGLVAYLVSDEATFISGANITVNAGRYMS